MQTSWKELLDSISSCTLCPLHEGRTQSVPGEGDPQAELMFIGEGPGAEEDRLGRPFVGAAGRLLDQALEALFIRRQDVYIANILKCRPPGNRVPQDDEANTCLAYLRAQVALVRPKIIVCLGATPAKYIIGPETRITQARGKWVERKGFLIMPTFHPAALLRDPRKKTDFWEDLKLVRDRLAVLKP
jgi:uracil-DNA glycosylase